ncbi:MAG: hypothetical protein ACWA5P_10000 [bacterium]
MKLQHLTALSLLCAMLFACNFDEKANQLLKEEIERDTGAKFETNEETISKSNATLQMTIDGESYEAKCNEHYINIAKEYNGETSYSIRYNFDKNDFKLNAFQLSFKLKEKIALPHEVELDFKKSATTNKLKTYLTVFYIDDDNKVIQTSNDVGKIIITEFSEEKVTMEVDTKLLLLKTVNIKGEGQTVHLKGTVQSSHPIITMMNGASKEDIF